jgi:FdrA protein
MEGNMTTSKVEIRSSAYYDSVILMQLQRSLAALPDVIDSGVVMGTEANINLLVQSDMSAPEVEAAGADDLVIVVKAKTAEAAQDALDQVDDLLVKRRSTTEHDYHPKSLETAGEMAPGAHWVLISVPGRYAADVAKQSLEMGKNIFLYSDNVSVEDEISLKQTAADQGLLVMGPDCGTAIVNGVGLGFANHVRRGNIGIVAASGTGLQQVSSRIHQLGGGITHAIGTGGRDLSSEVGAITTRQSLELLNRDPETTVIALISKPPSPEVAEKLIQDARALQKPVVVDFIGYAPPARQVDQVYFAGSFDETAALCIKLSEEPPSSPTTPEIDLEGFASGQRYLRGLFSGGTLAYEAQIILQAYLPEVYSNVPLSDESRLVDSLKSREHSIVDLGEDEFTVGRLHPMMDNDLRIRRLEKEAADPEVAVILLDVVLGYGAHPDPASELAPAIESAIKSAHDEKRKLVVVAVVVGTDEDPQDLGSQIDQLKAAGAFVEMSNDAATQYAGRIVQNLQPRVEVEETPLVDLAFLQDPLMAINAGLESFAESLEAQEADVVHVDWRPPAGGNEALMAILERMKGK